MKKKCIMIDKWFTWLCCVYCVQKFHLELCINASMQKNNMVCLNICFHPLGSKQALWICMFGIESIFWSFREQKNTYNNKVEDEQLWKQ